MASQGEAVQARERQTVAGTSAIPIVKLDIFPAQANADRAFAHGLVWMRTRAVRMGREVGSSVRSGAAKPPTITAFPG